MNTTREIVSLNFGQAGIQIGDAFWQTITAEHSIDADGRLINPTNNMELSGIKTFFHTGPNEQYIPRTLMVDSEPIVVDEIRTGYYRKLFHPDLMITGTEDAANNFGRGYYSISSKMIYPLIEKCRYIVETCDNFQGFMSYSGSGGGTGSGLFAMFLERVTIEYTSKIFIGSVVVPGKTLSNCVVDPYNTILKLSKSLDGEDLNFILDNESIYGICSQMDLAKPTYHNINRVISPLFSTITAPIRFGGPLSGALNEISTNLIPFPRINFPTMSYTPLIATNAAQHGLQSCQELTLTLFEKNNNLLSQNLCKGIFMSSVLIYRGYYVINEIIDSIYAIKKRKKCRWVDWCPTGFKITQTNYPALHTFSSQLAQPLRSILMLCNHSTIGKKFDQEGKKFCLLYRKRSYLHWYASEGMEEMEFANALDDFVKMKLDYEYICTNHNEDVVYEQSDDYTFSDNKKDKKLKESERLEYVEKNKKTDMNDAYENAETYSETEEETNQKRYEEIENDMENEIKDELTIQQLIMNENVRMKNIRDIDDNQSNSI